MDRQIDTWQIDRYWYVNRQTYYRYIDRYLTRYIEIQRDRYIDRQMGRQIDRQRDREIERDRYLPGIYVNIDGQILRIQMD